MGKKHKDKSSKSKKKKKSTKVSVVESAPENIQHAEPEPESIEYAEYVTAADVMELINSLEEGLEKLDKSNQLLKQQIAQNQKTPQRQYTTLKIITIILGVGIIAVGYSSAKTNSRMNENMSMSSSEMDKTTSRIKTMNTSIDSMTSDINKINTSLGKLSADVTTINQSVNKVASDVNKINTDTASKTYNTQYTGRPMTTRAPWR